MRLSTACKLTVMYVALTIGALLADIPLLLARENPASMPEAIGTVVITEASMHVVAIDARTNSVMLRGGDDHDVTVDVDPMVGDVKKLKVGDKVDIQYKGGLLLSADKTDTQGIRSRVESQSIAPESKGISYQLRNVEIVATVMKLDRKNRQVTLRGPERTVTLQIAPDLPLDRIKIGDNVRASYKAATAVEITRNGQPIR
ncbi:MAG TPA: hypothetical protein VN289_17505 [Paraburkholderia sp.]|jgi:hypothetical protein|nr:hypothetical protein [Paraburkholderia sp.]